MNNVISATTTRSAARGQAPNTQAAPKPIANTAQGLAQELASRSATALLPLDRATYGNVPTQLIKYFVHAIHRNQQPLHMLPI